ncbi:DUF2786 domain-containing protein [Moraxella bovis]|uniref:DUF2786 domain-containing protein n=1 Tax=Moraxella bovis TaxID=476 RepID=UPI000DC7552E|nr:DUF2786 domain-containing protein [Moraxella bovis]AWY19538.1 DUF2786 domain-containing protein [Moraxella bovis]
MNPKILEKIKHCLALSKSSNEHEAVTALRQAHALMKKHGVSEADIALSDIIATKNSQKLAQKPALYQVALAHVIADIFGCQTMIGYHDNQKRAIYFVGVGANAEIANYAYDVLFRQLKSARQTYIKQELSRVRLTKNKTARADAFCIGFVSQVKDLTAHLVVDNPHKEMIKAFVDKKTNGKQIPINKGSQSKSARATDYMHGVIAGKKAQLHNAVQSQTSPLALMAGGQR